MLPHHRYLKMIRPVFCSEVCTKQANNMKTKQTEKHMKWLSNTLLIPICIIPSERHYKLHMKEIKKKTRLGEMEMHNSIQSLGVWFESTPTTGPSVLFLYRLKSWKLMALIKPINLHFCFLYCFEHVRRTAYGLKSHDRPLLILTSYPETNTNTTRFYFIFFMHKWTQMFKLKIS